MSNNVKKMVWCLAVVAAPVNASASGSEPQPAPKRGRAEALEVYNAGVELMRQKRFERAEGKFREALRLKERFPEAHNNLAYCLRKQGADNFQEAMTHYDRAIVLDPSAPEPLMYRGVLFVHLQRLQDAQRDHQRLVDLKSPLATELAWVIEHGEEKEPEQFFGVSTRL